MAPSLNIVLVDNKPKGGARRGPEDYVDKSWSVAITASAVVLFGTAIFGTSGLFYVYFMDAFVINRESASWPTSTMGVAIVTSGIAVTLLQKVLGIFHVAIIGSVLLWASLVAAAFSPGIEVMTVFFGAFHGIGVGILETTMAMVIVLYFSKYRGIAMGLKDAGHTVAVLVFPTVVSKLHAAYGVRGTLCLCGALVMHVTALVLTLRRPPLVRSHPAIPRGSLGPLKAVPLDACKEESSKNVVTTPHIRGDFKNSSGNGHTDVEKTGKTIEGDVEHCTYSAQTRETSVRKEREFKRKNALTSAANQAKDSNEAITCIKSRTSQLNDIASPSNAVPSKYNATSDACPSSSDAIGPGDKKCLERSIKQPSVPTDRVPTTSTCVTFGRQVNVLLSDASFYVLVFQYTIAAYSSVIFRSVMVDYAMDKAVPQHHAQLLGTYCAVTDIGLGHCVIPMLADRSFVNRTLLVAATAACFSGLLFVLPEVYGFTRFLGVYCLASALMSAMCSLSPVIIADYLGVERVPTTYGASGLVTGPLLLVTPSITGFFRDKMGSYDNLMRLLGGLAGLCSLLLLLLWIQRRTRKMSTNF